MRAVVVGMGVVLGLCAAGTGAEAFSASYDQTVTQGGQVMNSTVSMKDTMFRMESTVGGRASVILHNDSGTYTYIPAEGIAMKVPAMNSFQGPVEHAGSYMQYLNELKAERIGAAMIDGLPCEIYVFTEPASQMLVTAWVWAAMQFPIRMEYNGNKGKMLVEIHNLQLGNAIPDSAFQLPAGVQVMDTGGMIPIGQQ